MIKLKKFLVESCINNKLFWKGWVKMEAKVLNGKELSTKIKEELKIEVEEFKKEQY